ncbi:uroporphyrinogen-III synthase [Oricola sp.]|uniref:uroporphyrinogen-III synthase n=1 Tax=Oricola sp. TaxID=1979950 RepID=UPI0025F91817|nr:uroporphyrinogen-III synthase [Oricola sp.]MCI5075515.1 uroporphyrinogen-III synthase [Oricola sp.]
MKIARAPLIWVTRPQPGADRTAAALRQAGYAPLVLPLTEIRACTPDLPPESITDVDALAITSANALRHAPTRLIESLKDRPLYAVGDATVAEARQLGFSDVISAQGAVDDLAALIRKRERPRARILYLAGRERIGDLEGKLTAGGLRCHVIEAYSAHIVSYPTQSIRDAINGRMVDAVLFHSALSAHGFADTVLPKMAQLFENTLYFSMSRRVADTLPSSLHPRTNIADTPNEQALLAAVKAALSTSAI